MTKLSSFIAALADAETGDEWDDLYEAALQWAAESIPVEEDPDGDSAPCLLESHAHALGYSGGVPARPND